MTDFGYLGPSDSSYLVKRVLDRLALDAEKRQLIDHQ